MDKKNATTPFIISLRKIVLLLFSTESLSQVNDKLPNITELAREDDLPMTTVLADGTMTESFGAVSVSITWPIIRKAGSDYERIEIDSQDG